MSQNRNAFVNNIPRVIFYWNENRIYAIIKIIFITLSILTIT